MKVIQTQIIITGIRAKVDGSLGLSMCTPELTAEEKVEFMKLQNTNIDATFIPKDEPNVPELKVNADMNSKTPSQRLRGVLYVIWEQNGHKDTFENFYSEQMNKVIEAYKSKLD